jgi:hypothetical protein
MENNFKIWIDIISSVGIIISISYGLWQIKLAKSSNSLNSILYIQKENFEVRKKLKKAIEQIEHLKKELNDNKESFGLIYGKSEFDELREFGYHYELIGLLVKNNSLNFKTVFELIHFPDEFWIESDDLIKTIRENYINDYLNNFEYLNNRYNIERIKRLK